MSERMNSDRDIAVMTLLTSLVRTPEGLDDKARADVIINPSISMFIFKRRI